MQKHSHHNENHSHEHHDNHNHADMMASPEAANSFLNRFYIVTALLIPLIALTYPVLNIVGIQDFALRPYLQFGISSIIFYFALVFFEHARHEIMMKQYGMMTLVSIAVGAGYLFSTASTFLPQLDTEFYIEISTLIWILLFGHYLEAKSSMAAGDALSEVAKLLPKQAHLKKDDSVTDVELSELSEGDIVVVKPGEKVPADGTIINGSANMDESLVSGESKPVEKGEGATVIAGSICTDSSIEIQIDKVGEHSTIGQIQALIANAQKSKPSTQRIADKAAGYLTFVALGTALLTLFIWAIIIGEPITFALTLGITVLVIACPHALGLAIPTVSTIATSKAVENGFFLKDLGKIEQVKDINYIVFDKTGTLTKGSFGVSTIVNAPDTNYTEKEILKIAASLEQQSSHVIATAIIEKSKNESIEHEDVNNFKNIAGKGITGTIAGNQYSVGNLSLLGDNNHTIDGTLKKTYDSLSSQGNTVVIVTDFNAAIGLIALSDEIKPEASEAIQSIHNMNINVAMLTGDTTQVAEKVAKDLSIDTFFAEVLPEDKYTHIKELQEQGNNVMMIGDGVNDAPALTQANIGVAIGAGTDVAVEAGDIVLTNNNPKDIVSLINLSNKVYRKMLQNLGWALGYNILALPAAAGLFIPFGFQLSPAIGALLMSLSSVIVVINAMTLKKAQL
ncbi:heavy metal translocating P-type ATPase [candidate division WWE3 bacterium]|uniref:Heavy metal translocating P-type ATPase n=1 Tax=candidate division WWE3 bacterium TaxID=2053526 RepID=A0A955LW20_UNCKA|nr:heavy metal translocating P-type ATPase [candidate division WWE3 bacterium]